MFTAYIRLFYSRSITANRFERAWSGNIINPPSIYISASLSAILDYRRSSRCAVAEVPAARR